MRTSSTHRRLVAALSASTLALVFSLGSPAFGGEKGQGDARRKGGDTSTTHRPASDSGDDDSIADTEPVPVDQDNAHPSGNDRHEDKGAQGHATSTPDQNGSGPERDHQGTDKSFETTADGAGGVDKQDQDGNNGCGNDDDFEDDNEGWCGQNPKKDRTSPPVVDDDGETPECVDDMTTDADECDDDEGEDKGEVGGEVITKTCPKAGEMTEGHTMVDGCATATHTHTMTAETVATGAVMASDLQNAPREASVLGVSLERTAPAAVAAGAATAPAGTSVLGVALARTGLSFTVLALAIALGLLAVGFALKRAGRTQSSF